MNINIEQIIKVLELLNNTEFKHTSGLATHINSSTNMDLPDNSCIDSILLGKICIIRTYSAGVWFGTLYKKYNNEIILNNARRLWKWKTKKSISLSSLAKYGVNQNECKFAPGVEKVWLQPIEIIPCSDVAIQSIQDTPDAMAS